MSAAPGWYDVGDGIERWHDGQAWTEERRPLATADGPRETTGGRSADALDALEVADTTSQGRVARWVRPRVAPLAVLGGVALAVIAAVVVGSVADSGVDASTASTADTYLGEAVRSCGMGPNSYGISLGDNDRSLTLDGRGQDDSQGAAIDTIACVLGALETPDSTLSLIDSTRALDGRQSATWDGYSASWSYHQDSGLSIVLVED